jgi:hypothetical protein
MPDSILFRIFCLPFPLYKTKKRNVAYYTMRGRNTLTMQDKFCCGIFLWTTVTCLGIVRFMGHACIQLRRRESRLPFDILCYEAVRISFYTSRNPVCSSIYPQAQETLCPKIYSVQLIPICTNVPFVSSTCCTLVPYCRSRAGYWAILWNCGKHSRFRSR